jgi:hypothetical protein
MRSRIDHHSTSVREVCNPHQRWQIVDEHRGKTGPSQRTHDSQLQPQISERIEHAKHHMIVLHSHHICI